MPRPGSVIRNFASNIVSPTLSRTGGMGRWSTRNSRSHGNSRSAKVDLAGDTMVAD